MGALAFSFNDVFAANDNFAYYNRLTKATKLDGTVLDFRYDGDGLRMESIKNGGAIDANYQISGGTRTRYVTSATEEIADISGARVVLARYIAGPTIDERIAQVDANGAVKYIHADKQSSVVAISNSSGAVISRRGYGSYGETTPTQLASNDNSPTHPFGYTGRRWDADLGLYYYRARWYDPELGTFLETDPIGSLDYINLYSYVGLDPMGKTDPSGMMPPEGITRAAIAREQAYLQMLVSAGSDLTPAEALTIMTMLSGGTACVAGGCEAAAALILANPTATMRIGAAVIDFDGAAGTGAILAGSAATVRVIGNAQTTKLMGEASGHGFASVRHGWSMVMSGEYSTISFNRSLKTLTGGAVDSRLRPDVAGINNAGKIDIVEILSPGQNKQDFIDKFTTALGDRLGTIKFDQPRR
jgi:RHS repeat-associated protein